jgi:hypothetical protein
VSQERRIISNISSDQRCLLGHAINFSSHPMRHSYAIMQLGASFVKWLALDPEADPRATRRTRVFVARVSPRLRAHGTGSRVSRTCIHVSFSLSLSLSLCESGKRNRSNNIPYYNVTRDTGSHEFVFHECYPHLSLRRALWPVCVRVHAHARSPQTSYVPRDAASARVHALALVRERAVCIRTRDALTDLASAGTLCVLYALYVCARASIYVSAGACCLMQRYIVYTNKGMSLARAHSRA